MMAPSIPSHKYKQRTISAVRTFPLGCGRPPPPPPQPDNDLLPQKSPELLPVSPKPNPDAFFFNRSRLPHPRKVSATRTFPTGCGRPDSNSRTPSVEIGTPEVEPTPSKSPNVCSDIIGFQEKRNGPADHKEALRVEPLRVDATSREPEALRVDPLRVDATFREPEALRVDPLSVDATFREPEALKVEPLSVDATFREPEALRVEPLSVDATFREPEALRVEPLRVDGTFREPEALKVEPLNVDATFREPEALRVEPLSVDDSYGGDEEIMERVPRSNIAGKSHMERSPYEVKKTPMMKKRGLDLNTDSRGKHGVKMSGSESNKRRLSIGEVERERVQSGSKFDGKGEEVVGDRMIVQCLMNAKSCPWRVGELSRTPRVQSVRKAAGKGSGSVVSKDQPSGPAEALDGRMIVQCLMNAANCPWRSGRKSNTPKQAR